MNLLELSICWSTLFIICSSSGCYGNGVKSATASAAEAVLVLYGFVQKTDHRKLMTRKYPKQAAGPDRSEPNFTSHLNLACLLARDASGSATTSRDI